MPPKDMGNNLLCQLHVIYLVSELATCCVQVRDVLYMVVSIRFVVYYNSHDTLG